MKIARVIITTECNLACSYCCNKMPEIQDSFKMTTMDQFLKMDYDVVNITGGEPLLVMDKLINLLEKLQNKKCKIYLYTNGTINDRIEELAKYLDGVNIGYHGDKNILRTALKWRSLLRNVRFHAQKDTKTFFEKPTLIENSIEIVEWKMNDCNNTKEDRWII